MHTTIRRINSQMHILDVFVLDLYIDTVNFHESFLLQSSKGTAQY